MKNIGIGTYELSEWIERLGSIPIKRTAHVHYAVDYKKRTAHVFELENGRYAFVSERGCSCYSPAEADIDIYPSKKKAMESFEKWKKENDPGRTL